VVGEFQLREFLVKQLILGRCAFRVYRLQHSGVEFQRHGDSSRRYALVQQRLNVHGLASRRVTISFTNQVITFTSGGTTYSQPVPDATVTFDPAATAATTTFNTPNNSWMTITPPGTAGNTFLAALAYPVPVALPGGVKPVQWSGEFSSDTSGVTINWQWAAAVYGAFGADYSSLGVKPTDDNKASVYQNSDHAGTPEAFKSYVVGGATGGGGSNYTGSYSGTLSNVCQ